MSGSRAANGSPEVITRSVPRSHCTVLSSLQDITTVQNGGSSPLIRVDCAASITEGAFDLLAPAAFTFARRHRARAILFIGLGRSHGLEYLAPPQLLRARRVRWVDQSMLGSTKPGSAAAPGREGDGEDGWGDAIGSPFTASARSRRNSSTLARIVSKSSAARRWARTTMTGRIPDTAGESQT